jgi:hypothetical protein
VNIAQIQIQPVDNGFVVQAVNIDGDKLNRKLVAQDVEGLRKAIHEIADQLYTLKDTPTEPKA